VETLTSMNKFMQRQRFSNFKCLFTEAAFEWSRITVRFFMNFQHIVPCKGFRTMTALERFIGSVNSLMTFQACFEVESLLTFITLKGSSSRVHYLVRLQVILTNECFVTLTTLEWFFTGVNTIMNLQVFFCPKRLRTDTALMSPVRIIMATFVYYQGLLVHKLPITNHARVRFLLNIQVDHTFVFHQFLWIPKSLITKRAFFWFPDNAQMIVQVIFLPESFRTVRTLMTERIGLCHLYETTVLFLKATFY
jgi:hypothetical protein